MSQLHEGIICEYSEIQGAIDELARPLFKAIKAGVTSRGRAVDVPLL
jgi:hypothetical protein